MSNRKESEGFNPINARTFLNIDPVILDLNGDGVKLTSYNNSEVTFYIDNDGKLETTGWVKGFKKILNTNYPARCFTR